MPPDPIRIAIIGLGKIACDQHIPAIAASENFELVATVDPNGEGQSGVHHFQDIAELVASNFSVDAVAICTPPRFRAELAATALDAGMHVFLEKPPASSIAQAEVLQRRANERGRSIFAAWHSREAAGVAPARERLAARELRSVSIIWREDVRVWHPGQKWIFEEHGFGVFDPAINALSIATAILPHPLTVATAELDIPANCAAPIAGTVRFIDAQGLSVSLDMDFLQTGPQTWDIAVETDQGTMLLSQGGRVLTTQQGTIAGADEEYRALYAKFAALVRAGESDFDLAPLALVEAALQRGQRREVEPFFE